MGLKAGMPRTPTDPNRAKSVGREIVGAAPTIICYFESEEMSKPADKLPVPFVHSRVINWSDTDAARIVYTVRFLDFAMEAIEQWFRTVIGYGWYEMNMDLGVGTPFVKADIDFKAPLTPRHRLHTTVLVERAGRASITFSVSGMRNDGVQSFSGRMVCCAIKTSEMKATDIPPEWRKRIEQYTDLCEENLEASRNRNGAAARSTRSV